jgi:hypothetical protein
MSDDGSIGSPASSRPWSMSPRILWTHVVPAFMGDARITSSARVSSASNASAASSLKKGGTGRSFQRRLQA